MVRIIGCFAASLLLGSSLWAGELDAEFGPKATGPAKAIVPVSGAPLLLMKCRTRCEVGRPALGACALCSGLRLTTTLPTLVYVVAAERKPKCRRPPASSVCQRGNMPARRCFRHLRRVEDAGILCIFQEY